MTELHDELEVIVYAARVKFITKTEYVLKEVELEGGRATADFSDGYAEFNKLRFKATSFNLGVSSIG